MVTVLIERCNLNHYDMRGQVAVITGGARGIGLAVAERLRAGGAGLALWDVSAEQLDAAAESLAATAEAPGGSRPARLPAVRTAVVDVTNEAEVAQATSAVLDAFGQIDILINSAGITGPNHPLWEYPAAEFARVLQVNVLGTFNCCKAIVPAMLHHGYGRIVNLASLAGKDGTANASRLFRIQGCSDRDDEIPRQGTCHPRRRGEFGGAGGRAHGDAGANDAGACQDHAFQEPDGPTGGSRGGCRAGGVDGLERMFLHDRISLRHFRRPRRILTDAVPLTGMPVQEPVMKGPLKPAPAGWPRISSALYYDDAETAIDWLCNAFGFMVRLKVAGEDGSIVHCELEYGNGLVMIGQTGREDEGKGGLAAPAGESARHRAAQYPESVPCMWTTSMLIANARAQRAPKSSASPTPPTMARNTGPTAAMARWIRKATCGGSCSACARPANEPSTRLTCLRLRQDLRTVRPLT